MSGRVYGLDEGAVARLAPWLASLLRNNLVPPRCAEDVRELMDEAAATQAAAVRRSARLHRDANSDRPVTQTAGPSEVSASCTVEQLAEQANVASAAVTHFLRRVDRSGRRLPRDGRRWGLIPADVAADFLAQSRKATQ